MLSGIAVLQKDVDDLQVVQDERVRAVSLRDGSVRPKGDLGQDARYERSVVRFAVEHGAVRAVVECVEGDLERNRARGVDEGLDFYGHKADVGHVVVGFDGTSIVELRGGVVRDRGREVWWKREAWSDDGANIGQYGSTHSSAGWAEQCRTCRCPC